MPCPKAARPIPALVAALFTTALLTAQASFTTFGTPCRVDLRIGAQNLPRIGQTFVVTHQGPYDPSFSSSGTQSHQPFLVLGLSNTQAGAVPLPFVLPAGLTGGLANCALLVSPDATLLFPVVPGMPPVRPFPLPIPNQQALVGAVFHVQWANFTFRRLPNTTPAGVTLSLSDAGTATVGV